MVNTGVSGERSWSAVQIRRPAVDLALLTLLDSLLRTYLPSRWSGEPAAVILPVARCVSGVGAVGRGSPHENT